MKKETVEKVIDMMSGGNKDLKTILEGTCKICQEKIESWPNYRTGRLINGLKKTTDHLINDHFGTNNFRTNFEEIISKGPNYWDLPEGRNASIIFGTYLQDKLKDKVNVGRDK